MSQMVANIVALGLADALGGGWERDPTGKAATPACVTRRA